MTLDDVEVGGKTVLARIDINSPIDSETGEILDDNRIKMSSSTLEELSEKGAKIVVMAHQGRPGRNDFTTLENHAKKINQTLDLKVEYVDEIFGSSARNNIKNLESGEVLLLENMRFYSEEVINKPAEEQANTHLVRKLSPLADLYVNDAFAAAHRSHPSLVGFPITLPGVAGRLLEKEIRELGRAQNPEHPCTYLLGGAKVSDSLLLIEHILENEIADYVLTGGLIGNVLLAVNHEIGGPNTQVLLDKGYENEIDRAKEIISTYKNKIKIPQDVRVEEKNGEANSIPVNQLPTDKPIYDIGDKTISEYSKTIQDSKTVIANGPVGVFEKPAFAKGTNELLNSMVKSGSYTIIGGGHMVASAREIGITQKIDHVSTGGGSCLNFLSGEKLPVIEALKKSVKINKKA
ncbi:MAG: phosphoglycerate kinase [Hadesarchaea archaeon]|nr:phosphoglycerate kinase [Hadesarchaea archaeon]